MALISGVMPRRRRDQISRGRVLSRPIRKKLTAISSIDMMKIRSASPKNIIPGKRRAVERQRRRHSESQCQNYGSESNNQAVTHRAPDGIVAAQHAVPIESQITGWESSHPLAVEGVHDEDGNRKIKKGEQKKSIQGKPAR